MKPQKFGLYCEALDEFRTKMDLALGTAARNLMEKRLIEGSVSAKIKIIIKERVNDKTGEITHLIELEPDANIKIGGKGKLECAKMAGFILQEDKNGEMVIASQQISMDDIQKGA